MKLDKVVRKANTLIVLELLSPQDALVTTLRQHGLKIKNEDGDYYLVGSNKSTGIITRKSGLWEC